MPACSFHWCPFTTIVPGRKKIDPDLASLNSPHSLFVPVEASWLLTSHPFPFGSAHSPLNSKIISSLHSMSKSDIHPSGCLTRCDLRREGASSSSSPPPSSSDEVTILWASKIWRSFPSTEMLFFELTVVTVPLFDCDVQHAFGSLT